MQIVTLLAVTQSSMQFFFTAGIPVALTRYKRESDSGHMCVLAVLVISAEISLFLALQM